MSKARVLVIDDHLYFRSFMEGVLEEEGYRVRSADGGAAGLELLEQEGPFDVVLTDLVMPGMDGIETVRRIRERNPDQDVLVVTGVGDVRSAVEALRVGAAEYLLKPVEREDLVHSIESVLEQRRLRREHDRLVAENRAFLGCMSVLERGIHLLAELRREDVAERLLELLCIEARAGAGAVWVRDGEHGGETFTRLAARGSLAADDETLPHLPRASGDSLRQGQVNVEGGSGSAEEGGPTLWVPSTRDGQFWAIARLSDFEQGSVLPEARAACAKLGELAAIAFQNATRARGLERQSLRDSVTGLHTRAFLEEAVLREIHRGRRHGRPFALLCLEAGEPSGSGPEPSVARRIGSALERALRPAEVVAAEGTRVFWALAAEADAIGSVVVKGRLVDAIRSALPEPPPVSIGAANFPADGESFGELADVARARVEEDRRSLAHVLGLPKVDSLSELLKGLRYRAAFLPEGFVPGAIELVLDEVRSRPEMRGLLFLAPGEDRSTVSSRLGGLGRRALATSIFLATDGDTVPLGPGLTPIALPRGISAATTWLVRFGEAPPYILVAGPPGRAEGRPVFHSNDRSLVEHVVSKLRAEVGFGVGARA